MTIQRVELNTFYDVDIHCPFCGHLALKQVSDKASYIDDMFSSCKHTLFYAYDDDLHYRNEDFEADMGTRDKTSDEISEGADFEHWDGFTDKVAIPDSIKFAMYVGASSGHGSYIGFAPS